MQCVLTLGGKLTLTTGQTSPKQLKKRKYCFKTNGNLNGTVFECVYFYNLTKKPSVTFIDDLYLVKQITV